MKIIFVVLALKFGQLEMLFSLTEFEVTTKHPHFPENHFRNQFEVNSNAAKETDTSYEKIQKCSKDITIFSSNLKHIFGMDNVEIWLSLFLKKL